MTAPSRSVAEGADRFRRSGLLESLAGYLGHLPVRGPVRRELKRLYRLALGIRSRGRGLPRVLPGGEVIRVAPECDYLSWNPDEYRAFREAVRPGMVALDIGANVGAYATLLGRWVGATGRVFAFEPAPQPFQGLVRHIQLNELSDIVVPIRAAVAGSAATAHLFVGETVGESRFAVASDPVDRTLSVPVTTVDEFCARERVVPDFIKIDVEGGELDVLRGARETIAASSGRLALFVEMHPTLWPTFGFGLDEMLAELRALSLAPQPLVPTMDLWATEGICVRLGVRS
jgi:FkbM family methyltransferase